MARLSSSFTFLFLYFFLENNNYFFIIPFNIIWGNFDFDVNFRSSSYIVCYPINWFIYFSDILLIVPIIFNSTITWGEIFF